MSGIARLAFSLLAAPALAYQLAAVFAACRALRRCDQRRFPPFTPGVSVLKPLRGTDPEMERAFLSQAQQDYPQFEILLGVSTADDPAVAAAERLMRNRPELPIRLVVGRGPGLNPKVGVLRHLAEHARHPVWVVNDSDISVARDYLRRVVQPLVDPGVALVTCRYRPRPHSLASTWEALGIATDFMVSTMVAPLTGVKRFGFGSTLAFRRDDLRAAGGFAAVADFLADDYQLAKCLTVGGKSCWISDHVVETSLGDSGWRQMWRHQLRWSRTIRRSQGAGHAGLPVTQAGVWVLVLFLAGNSWVGGALFATRLATAYIAGWRVLRSPVARRLFWLAPLWDLFAFLVWLASYASSEVRWRGEVMEIDAQGRIVQN